MGLIASAPDEVAVSECTTPAMTTRGGTKGNRPADEAASGFSFVRQCGSALHSNFCVRRADHWLRRAKNANGMTAAVADRRDTQSYDASFGWIVAINR